MFRSLLFAAALLTGSSFCVSAQTTRSAVAPKAGAVVPPAAVQTAFAQRFPKATAVKWEKEAGAYEATFLAGKVEISAVFTAAGKFREIERAVALTALPAPVLPYVQKHYPGQKIKEAARIKDAAGTVTWEAEVGKKDVIFDVNGAFLREASEAAEPAGTDND